MRLVVGPVLLACVALAALPPDAHELPTSRLAEMASRAISTDAQTALDIYGILLERQPDDISTIYKASSLQLSLGQHSKAKQGFSKVLELKPDQDQARLQLARLHARLAEYDQAMNHINKYMKQHTSQDRDAVEASQLKADLDAVQAHRMTLDGNRGNRQVCQPSLDALVTLSPYSSALRLERARCALLSPDPNFPSALADISRAASLDPSLSSDWLVKAAVVSAFFVDEHMPNEYQAFLKRCLAADPDNRTCARTLRELKKVKKDLDKLANWRDSSRWNEAVVTIRGATTGQGGLIETAERIIRTDPDLDDKQSPVTTMLLSTLCKAYVSLGSTRKASEPCRAALERNPDDAWALVSKAADAEKDEEWDSAVAALTKAFEATGRSDRDILARLQKAQRLLKQSKTKDYYKVLGVSRDADDKAIKRAYRKATLKAHPDKEGGSQEQMAALNEAYGVLSDPQLRARFDAGDDPNDPQQGQQGGAGGFGGQPFFFHGAGGQHGSAGGNPFQFFQQFQQQAGGFPGGGGSFKVQFG